MKVFLVFTDRYREGDENGYVVTVLSQSPGPSEVSELFGKTFRAMYFGLNADNNPEYQVERPGDSSFLVWIEEWEVARMANRCEGTACQASLEANDAKPLHTCPFQEEMSSPGDDRYECNCCDSCYQECCWSI